MHQSCSKKRWVFYQNLLLLRRRQLRLLEVVKEVEEVEEVKEVKEKEGEEEEAATRKENQKKRPQR